MAIDATAVSPVGKGISRAQQKLVEGLVRLDLPFELVALIRDSANGALLADGASSICVGRASGLLTEQVVIPRAICKRRIDAVVTTSERLPLYGARRYLIWLFEIPTHRIEQNRVRRASVYRQGSDILTLALWKRSLSRAARVAAASTATAREISAFVPEVGPSVRVVHAGVDEQFRPGLSVSRERYVFMLGSDDPRDNLDVAIEAFAQARARVGQNLKLLIAGDLGSRRGAVEREVSRRALHGTVECLGRVPDEVLSKLYRGATAYLDTTIFEGFGYQPLEAMASGAPVVVSGVASLLEVVGDAGLLCDPRSEAEFADALTRVLIDDALAVRLRKRGLERAAMFAWEQTAQKMADLITGVLIDASRQV